MNLDKNCATLWGSLKIKMADGGIQRSIFIAKHDGSIDFSINQKTSVQKILIFHVGILEGSRVNYSNECTFFQNENMPCDLNKFTEKNMTHTVEKQMKISFQRYASRFSP